MDARGKGGLGGQGTPGRAWLLGGSILSSLGTPDLTSASEPQPLGDKRVIKLIPGFAVMRRGTEREGGVITRLRCWGWK